jgi:hypothetical protein
MVDVLQKNGCQRWQMEPNGRSTQSYNAAKEVLQNRYLKDTYKAAVQNGVEIVVLK